jgi:hypothetical protein
MVGAACSKDRQAANGWLDQHFDEDEGRASPALTS